ncbi:MULTISPECIES: hypothetical protein [Nostoc]|uniref:Uncharacterized protein n=1 Tax=Nostoc paludosum FACHB-159 TaxID=2692908 RepID=A0ABR8KE11_9NOSO|nr:MULTISPECIES: hypothetical protein [Nostoc]MBD2680085.1 hypothetical protein [Nostoc sp. FACHB-857]MBD2736342.1 hypothetical protein [Nostoc paludosum FACHB-159]
MQAIIWLILWAAMGFVCMQIAEKKGRNPTLWLVVGFFLGILGVLIVALLPHA